MAAVGYARVSTADQDSALQLDALLTAGCAKVFEDRASGAHTDRLGLRAALDYARDGDVLVAWKLDRLGRSLPHLIETVSTLEQRGDGEVGVSPSLPPRIFTMPVTSSPRA
ncbi:recombinase family protein [Roseomonas gilardii]